jgi:hypothetical protein
MKQTNLQAKVIYLTPEIAENLLQQNKGNRKLKRETLRIYINDMKDGRWKENGEPIIIDINGVVKDGQHRLTACIKANYSFHIPLITGVDPDVMDTIDTGSNRSLSDVLQLNGYKNSASAAALVKAILNYKNKRKALSSNGTSFQTSITNSQGLDYMNKNSEMIDELVLLSHRYGGRQTIKSFRTTQIGFYAYVLTGGDLENIYIDDFMKELCGIKIQEGNAVSYVRKVATKSKQDKIRLDGDYVLALVIKAWNSYVSGDPVIQYMRHDIKKGLPDVIKV